MNKLIDYRRNGPGVRKQKRVYSMADFWHTYFEKFFKLMGLNVIYFVCLALVAALCYFPLNSVLDSSNSMKQKFSKYELNSDYSSLLSAYCEAYKIEDSAVDKALPYFESALDRIQKVNGDVLKDGPDGFLYRSYSEEDKTAIFDAFSSAFAELKLYLSSSENGTYELLNAADRSVATITISENKLDIESAIPRSLSTLVKVFLCLAPLILLSPVHLSMFRVTRDYVQGTPSFMLSDLWDTFKKNWWQGFVLGLIAYFGFSIIGVSLVWYWNYFYSGFVFKLGLCLCLVLLYIFLSMNFYLGIMQVSLDMSFCKIIKNAFFFSIICLWRNLFMILITLLLVVFFAIAYIFGMANTVIMSLTFTLLLIAFFSFWFYFVSYMTYPSVLQYVVDPYYENLNKEQEAAQEDSQAETDNSESEYVYYNGRMVHRSVLEEQSLFSDDTTENK